MDAIEQRLREDLRLATADVKLLRTALAAEVEENERLRVEVLRRTQERDDYRRQYDSINWSSRNWTNSMRNLREENEKLREGFNAPNGRVANYWYDRARRIEEVASTLFRHLVDSYGIRLDNRGRRLMQELDAALADQPTEEEA